jgi:hypothetical protein
MAASATSHIQDMGTRCRVQVFQESKDKVRRFLFISVRIQMMVMRRIKPLREPGFFGHGAKVVPV